MTAPADWDELSRELHLTVDRDGVITRADGRAARIVGAKVGQPLLALAVDGTEHKVEQLLARARAEELRDWEVSLVSGSRAPATLLVSTRRRPDGGLELLAHALPDGHGATVMELNAALAEVADLSRQIARQRKELEAKHAQLERAYAHLDDSNKGVLRLHAELADKNEVLRRSAEVKGRVVANVSHEFRTPLHTILGLSRLLLDGADGPLADEQRKQLRFIRSSAEELSSLVDDMLDLSSTESGKMQLRPERFTVADLFASLRGMLRPLLPAAGQAEGPVALVFDDPPDLRLDTDLGKVSQIVRNLVSNALSFTEVGEVRVTASRQGGLAVFQVKDTGVGIAPRDHERIFEEFGQVDGPLQRKRKGTGLGLPLSRRLAELLGGSLTLESAAGAGATFTLSIPVEHPEVKELRSLEARPLDPTRSPVLVVEDDRKTIFIYEKYLAMAGFQVLPARNVDDARRLLAGVRPAAIVLDIMLEGESSWQFLADLKQDPATKDIPVLVVTVTGKEQKARALGADEFWLKPVDKDRLLRKLKTLGRGAPAKVLAIDDDERSRYLLRRLLEQSPYELIEAATGPDGVARARERRPDVILLDFLLEDSTTAFDVLDELKADPRTRTIPVIVVTSHVLDAAARERLAVHTEAVLSKESLSRELAINRIRDALAKSGVHPGVAPHDAERSVRGDGAERSGRGDGTERSGRGDGAERSGRGHDR